MNVLMVGASRAGSWTIRGEQLGAAIGARVCYQPTPADLAWAEVVVLVKRAWRTWRPGCTAAAVVWDALDFWEQPAQNGYSEDRAKTLLRSVIADIQPALVIGATKAMAEAAGGVYLPHHARPGLTPAPAREQVQVVAYEGNPAYLGRWAEWLTQACKKRGWSFVVNPERLTDADIVVALRDGHWDGWMCREWKSGVKLANAIAAGRPVITQDTAAFTEMEPLGLRIGTVQHLDSALDALSTDVAIRTEYALGGPKRILTYSLDTIADRYRQILQGVACPA